MVSDIIMVDLKAMFRKGHYKTKHIVDNFLQHHVNKEHSL